MLLIPEVVPQESLTRPLMFQKLPGRNRVKVQTLLCFAIHILNTRTGEENRHVSYLENSQDRDQALLIDEDK